MKQTVVVILIVILVALVLDLSASERDRTSPGATVTPTLAPTVPVALPPSDIEGRDIPDLSRYPGALRTEYGQELDEGLWVIEVEYRVRATIQQVRSFYTEQFRRHRWEIKSLDLEEGEWQFTVARGDREALVELEPTDGIVEIEIEVSEPGDQEPERGFQPGSIRLPRLDRADNRSLGVS